MKRTFIPTVLACLFAVAFVLPDWAKAEDGDCTECPATNAPCSDCDQKPQPPDYPAGQFDLEESDQYDHALANWKSDCASCKVEVGPIESIAPEEY